MNFFPPFSYEKEKENKTMYEFLYSLKEFREYATCERKDSSFLNHQKIIARFIGPYTIGEQYNNLLILHDVGTGKSGIVCSVFEEYYRFFRNEFNFIYLSNNEVTKNNFIQEFIKLSPSYKSISKEMVKKKANHMKYNIFIMKYSNTDLNRLEKRISSFNQQTIIILDEVHNLVNRGSITEQKKVPVHDENKLSRLQSFFQKFPQRKLVLMTGTPVRHQIEEILPIFSLLLNEKIPLNLFETSGWKQSLQEILKKVNISCFQKQSSEKIKITYQVGDESLQHYNQDMFHKVYFQMMNPYQSNYYLKNLFDVRKNRKTSTMDDRMLHRHAVIVDEEIFLQKMNISGITHQEKMRHLKDHSIIFYHIMEQHFKEPEQKIFVYSKYIEYAGIEIFVKILNCFGKQHGKDFIRLSCESRCSECNQDIHTCECTEKYDSIKTKELVQLFNDRDDIKIIIGSDNQSEGISFLNIEQIHIVSAWWNYGRTKQAIGRGIRYKSHQTLFFKKEKLLLKKILQEKQKNTPFSFREFLQKKYHQEKKTMTKTLNHNEFIQMENEDFFLGKLLETDKYKSQITTPTIEVRLFLHCALPIMEEYTRMLNQVKTEQFSKSAFEMIQLKQYQTSSIQEKKIEDLTHEIYLHSIDLLLNQYNNHILGKSQNENQMTIQDVNYNDIYLEENNTKIVNQVFSFLEKRFCQSPTSKSFQELWSLFPNEKGEISKIEFSHALLTLLSKNTHFYIEKDKKVFLRYKNNYFYLHHCKNSHKYTTNNDNLLPPFYPIQQELPRKQKYNLESIKETLNYKRKLDELGLTIDNLVQTKHLTSTTMYNKVQSLPKRIRYQIGGDLDKKNKKDPKLEFLQSVINHPKFLLLQNSLEKNIIGIQMGPNFFIYFINEVNLKMTSVQIDEKIKTLLHIIKNSFKNQFVKVFESKTLKNWEMIHENITNIVNEVEKLYQQTKNRKNIFHMTWDLALHEITTFLNSHPDFVERKGLKKLFHLESSMNFMKDSKFKFNGKDIYNPYYYQYIIWINVQMIHYNKKSFHFKDKLTIEKWEFFCKQYLTDKRLDSSGRKLDTIYFPMLYKIFSNYLTEQEKESIRDQLESYEKHLREKKFETERPKHLDITTWRKILISFLEKRNQVFSS